MAKTLINSLKPLMQRAQKKKNLLCVHWSAHWSAEARDWLHKLEQNKDWTGLRAELECVTIDRDLYPEEDQALQSFVNQRLHLSGWPLTLFVDPEREELLFAAGSVETEAMLSLTRQLLVAWQVDSGALRKQAAQELEAFRKEDPLALTEPGFAEDGSHDDKLNKKLLFRYLTPLEQSLDLSSGFLGRGNVFLHPELYRSLISYEDLARFGKLALVQLARSPLYDPIEGAFFRSLKYRQAQEGAGEALFEINGLQSRSTEKLLIENSEMMQLYAEAWKLEQNPFFSQVSHEILEWILENLKVPAKAEEGFQFYSALSMPSEYYEITATDLLEAVDPKHRQAAQLFFGLVEGNKAPYIAQEMTVLSEYLGEEPVDLRLALSDSRKRLKHYRQTKKGEAMERILAPLSRLAELTLLQSMAYMSFAFESPEAESVCESLMDRFQDKVDEDWSLREKAALLRGYCAMSRLYASQRDHERSREMLKKAESLIQSLKDPLIEEGVVDSAFFGRRLELCDHTGMSGLGGLIHGLLDFNSLQKMGLRGSLNLPVDVAPLLGECLNRSRPLGVHAASIYSALMRYLKVEKAETAHA